MSKISKPDFRTLRAKQMTSMVLKEIFTLRLGDIELENLNQLYERLFNLFYNNGLSLITDDEREFLNLEPRDIKGYTPSENLKEELHKLKILKIEDI